MQEAGLAAIASLEEALGEFDAIIDNQDKQEVPIIQQKCLDYVGNVEEAMVKGFPFEVPAEYASLPQLKVPASTWICWSLTQACTRNGLCHSPLLHFHPCTFSGIKQLCTLSEEGHLLIG